MPGIDCILTCTSRSMMMMMMHQTHHASLCRVCALATAQQQRVEIAFTIGAILNHNRRHHRRCRRRRGLKWTNKQITLQCSNHDIATTCLSLVKPNLSPHAPQVRLALGWLPVFIAVLEVTNSSVRCTVRTSLLVANARRHHAERPSRLANLSD